MSLSVDDATPSLSPSRPCGQPLGRCRGGFRGALAISASEQTADRYHGRRRGAPAGRAIVVAAAGSLTGLLSWTTPQGADGSAAVSSGSGLTLSDGERLCQGDASNVLLGTYQIYIFVLALPSAHFSL